MWDFDDGSYEKESTGLEDLYDTFIQNMGSTDVKFKRPMMCDNSFGEIN